MGKKWTKAQHLKFKATLRRKKNGSVWNEAPKRMFRIAAEGKAIDALVKSQAAAPDELMKMSEIFERFQALSAEARAYLKSRL